MEDPVDAPPVEAGTVCEAFQRVVTRYPDRPALRTLGGELTLTWAQLGRRVAAVAAGLAGLGIRHGDTIAMLLPNTPECHLVDYAAVHLGAVPFTIFNSSPPAQIEHQVRRADAAIMVTQRAFLPQVREALNRLEGQVKHLVVIDGDGADGTLTLADVEAAAVPGFDFGAAWRAVRADDLVTIIYTSGTTGTPKAAQWSHRTAMAQQRALAAAVPVATDGLISFLPLAHAGGRITAHYMALIHGATITTCPDMKQVAAYFIDARPDVIFSVPRVWEKLQVAIEAMIESEPDPDHRAEVRAALDASLRQVRAQDGGTGSGQAAPELQASGKLLRPILAKLGLENVKGAFVGGAPSPPELSQFFRAVGIPLLEAYGLTEASLPLFNRVDDFRCGTAGKPLPGVEIRIADDGELLARSEFSMAGYRGDPEQTAAVLDADGWLHSGDIATIDEQGFVTIIDRKKELIISSSGKNMSPVSIESAIGGESSLIGQVLAVGDKRNYVAALITLDPEAAAVRAKRLGLDAAWPGDLAGQPEIRREVEEAVTRGNQRLNRSEQIKKFALLPVAWLPDSDELTPTGKLKRKAIQAKYADQIESLYQDKDAHREVTQKWPN
jgi:long-subunit acyl-CoA synthetase (AMP-forming)